MSIIHLFFLFNSLSINNSYLYVTILLNGKFFFYTKYLSNFVRTKVTKYIEYTKFSVFLNI